MNAKSKDGGQRLHGRRAGMHHRKARALSKTLKPVRLFVDNAMKGVINADAEAGDWENDRYIYKVVNSTLEEEGKPKSQYTRMTCLFVAKRNDPNHPDHTLAIAHAMEETFHPSAGNNVEMGFVSAEYPSKSLTEGFSLRQSQNGIPSETSVSHIVLTPHGILMGSLSMAASIRRICVLVFPRSEQGIELLRREWVRVYASTSPVCNWNVASNKKMHANHTADPNAAPLDAYSVRLPQCQSVAHVLETLTSRVVGGKERPLGGAGMNTGSRVDKPVCVQGMD